MKIMATLMLSSACLVAGFAAQAEPVVAYDDAQVIEVLPAVSGGRAQERQLRRAWAANPSDEAVATALARHELEQARSEGDPRRAGQALAALQAWPDPASAPDDVLLLRATVEQYLHEFDNSAAHLELLVHRKPQSAQAWLTLATVRRVQGRYVESSRACAALGSAGAWLYAQACLAENEGLLGHVQRARQALTVLLAAPRLDAGTKNWLWTSMAELEARAGRPAESEAAYRHALAAQHDSYTVLSFADFFILRSRDADALALLASEPRSDAVLLRLAIAGTRARSRTAGPDAQEMRERMQQAALRPGAFDTHAREQAMFALWVDQQPQRALQLARRDVRIQREALDLIVFAQAARAAGQLDALHEMDSIRKNMGFHDERLDALL